ncbi:hypothetical protein [Gloeocapsopsis sp. IPPAS B-1203]|uniref:hypothetical protein n=1 Tax=Gloeocapsopsis sp. IPPAS B-1203 TaxID=2049454 RepID=UPI0025A09675|nr:hypothetical protein [Gloeocapsopsis sp. IPPAS B-1203]
MNNPTVELVYLRVLVSKLPNKIEYYVNIQIDRESSVWHLPLWVTISKNLLFSLDLPLSWDIGNG